MAQVIADRRDVDFVLHEQLGVSVVSKHEKFADFNKKAIDLVVSEAKNLAVKELLPVNKIGDQKGCTFKDGKVIVPEEFRRPFKLFNEGEWLAMTEDPEWGGQGMPKFLYMAASDYLIGSNFPLLMYASLTHGAANLIYSFGTEEIKKVFLRNMYTGKWTGTMLLTEPGAGSDVGALTASAVKNDDGTYSITGDKIFISSGDHDLAENIIHPVLARIEGAPAGTKGISLFLVPKIWVNPDGSLGEPNDVVCTGIEEKMGIHGNATCSLSLGSKGKCRGFLLGEENKGMRAMFHMMNEARLLVGMQASACASSSYLNAVNYARERKQGKNLLKSMDQNAPSVSIIEHPDIRRQLMLMKTYVEGARSLLYYLGLCEDLKNITDSKEEKDRFQGIIDVLIPIAKGYVSDKAFDVCSHGVQVYGGYGYIKEFPQEQLLRDSRIAMIYEGTNGIQAMDLLGRKLGLNKGKAVMDLMTEVQRTVKSAGEFDSLKDLAADLEKALKMLGDTAMTIGAAAMSEKVMTAFAFAHPFLEVTGDVVMSWMLLWRASVASKQLAGSAKKKDVPFYEGQIKSAEFFINSILPVTLGKIKAISKMNQAAVEISEDSFGGK